MKRDIDEEATSASAPKTPRLALRRLTGTLFALPDDQEVTVGRGTVGDGRLDIGVPHDSSSISRAHLKLRASVDGSAVELTALGQNPCGLLRGAGTAVAPLEAQRVMVSRQDSLPTAAHAGDVIVLEGPSLSDPRALPLPERCAFEVVELGNPVVNLRSPPTALSSVGVQATPEERVSISVGVQMDTAVEETSNIFAAPTLEGPCLLAGLTEKPAALYVNEGGCLTGWFGGADGGECVLAKQGKGLSPQRCLLCRPGGSPCGFCPHAVGVAIAAGSDNWLHQPTHASAAALVHHAVTEENESGDGGGVGEEEEEGRDAGEVVVAVATASAVGASIDRETAVAELEATVLLSLNLCVQSANFAEHLNRELGANNTADGGTTNLFALVGIPGSVGSGGSGGGGAGGGDCGVASASNNTTAAEELCAALCEDDVLAQARVFAPAAQVVLVHGSFLVACVDGETVRLPLVGETDGSGKTSTSSSSSGSSSSISSRSGGGNSVLRRPSLSVPFCSCGYRRPLWCPHVCAAWLRAASGSGQVLDHTTAREILAARGGADPAGLRATVVRCALRAGACSPPLPPVSPPAAVTAVGAKRKVRVRASSLSSLTGLTMTTMTTTTVLAAACAWVRRRDEVECDLAKGWASLRVLALPFSKPAAVAATVHSCEDADEEGEDDEDEDAVQQEGPRRVASPCATAASLTVRVKRLTALATSAAATAAAAVPITAAPTAAAAVPAEELAELAASHEEGCRHALWAAGLHGLALELSAALTTALVDGRWMNLAEATRAGLGGAAKAAGRALAGAAGSGAVPTAAALAPLLDRALRWQVVSSGVAKGAAGAACQASSTWAARGDVAGSLATCKQLGEAMGADSGGRVFGRGEWAQLDSALAKVLGAQDKAVLDPKASLAFAADLLRWDGGRGQLPAASGAAFALSLRGSSPAEASNLVRGALAKCSAKCSADSSAKGGGACSLSPPTGVHQKIDDDDDDDDDVDDPPTSAWLVAFAGGVAPYSVPGAAALGLAALCVAQGATETAAAVDFLCASTSVVPGVALPPADATAAAAAADAADAAAADAAAAAAGPSAAATAAPWADLVRTTFSCGSSSSSSRSSGGGGGGGEGPRGCPDLTLLFDALKSAESSETSVTLPGLVRASVKAAACFRLDEGSAVLRVARYLAGGCTALPAGEAGVGAPSHGGIGDAFEVALRALSCAKPDPSAAGWLAERAAASSRTSPAVSAVSSAVAAGADVDVVVDADVPATKTTTTATTTAATTTMTSEAVDLEVVVAAACAPEARFDTSHFLNFATALGKNNSALALALKVARVATAHELRKAVPEPPLHHHYGGRAVAQRAPGPAVRSPRLLGLSAVAQLKASLRAATVTQVREEGISASCGGGTSSSSSSSEHSAGSCERAALLTETAEHLIPLLKDPTDFSSVLAALAGHYEKPAKGTAAVAAARGELKKKGPLLVATPLAGATVLLSLRAAELGPTAASIDAAVAALKTSAAAFVSAPQVLAAARGLLAAAVCVPTAASGHGGYGYGSSSSESGGASSGGAALCVRLAKGITTLSSAQQPALKTLATEAALASFTGTEWLKTPGTTPPSPRPAVGLGAADAQWALQLVAASDDSGVGESLCTALVAALSTNVPSSALSAISATLSSLCAAGRPHLAAPACSVANLAVEAAVGALAKVPQAPTSYSRYNSGHSQASRSKAEAAVLEAAKALFSLAGSNASAAVSNVALLKALALVPAGLRPQALNHLSATRPDLAHAQGVLLQTVQALERSPATAYRGCTHSGCTGCNGPYNHYVQGLKQVRASLCALGPLGAAGWKRLVGRVTAEQRAKRNLSAMLLQLGKEPLPVAPVARPAAPPHVRSTGPAVQPAQTKAAVPRAAARPQTEDDDVVDLT